MPIGYTKCSCGAELRVELPYQGQVREALTDFYVLHVDCLPVKFELTHTTVGEVSETVIKPADDTDTDTDDILPYDAETNPVVFGVGDTVKVCRKMDVSGIGWDARMDQFIGEVGVISDLASGSVDIIGFGGWSYPVESLGLVKAAEKKAESDE